MVSGKAESQKIWREVESFLYPPWYKGSGYRGDITYTPDIRLLQEFYQWPERLTADDREGVPDALERAKDAVEKNWLELRRETLEAIRSLPETARFHVSDVQTLYGSTMARLLYEGVLLSHGGGYFELIGE